MLPETLHQSEIVNLLLELSQGTALTSDRCLQAANQLLLRIILLAQDGNL